MFRKLFGRKKEPERQVEERHYLSKIVKCTCGVLIPTQEGLDEHERLGHFHLQEFELTEEHEQKIRDVVKGHGKLSIGRSGRNSNRETGCEAYYFCFADAGPPRTPTLYWNDNPNITSAFVRAAYEYASSL